MPDSVSERMRAFGGPAPVQGARGSVSERMRAFGGKSGSPSLAAQLGEAIEGTLAEDVLTFLAKPGATATNLLSAGIETVKGNSGLAQERLEAAGRVMGSVFGAVDMQPGDFLGTAQVLEEQGVGELFRVDLPIFGEVSGRDIAGLAGDIFTDPLIYTRLGGLTRAGVKARKAGKLATGKLDSIKQLPSKFGAQARAGQRSLLTFARRNVIRGAPMLEYIERMGFKIRTAPIINNFFSRKGLPTDEALDRFIIKNQGQLLDEIEQAKFIRTRMAALGKEMGEDVRFVSALGLGRLEKRGKRAFLPKAGGKEASARGGARALERSRKVYKDYLDDGLSPKEAGRATQAVILRGAPADELTGLTSQAFEQMKRFGLKEIESGGLLSTLSDPGLYYMLRYLTPESRQIMGKAGRGEFRNFFDGLYARSPSEKQRSLILRGMDHPEVEQWFRANFKDKIDDFAKRNNIAPEKVMMFETDPLKLAEVRGKRQARVSTIGDFLRDTAENYGRPDSDALRTAGWIDFDDIVRGAGMTPERKLKFGKFAKETGEFIEEKRLLHPEIAKALAQTTRILADPKTPTGILKSWDGFLRMWKIGVTAIVPEFHARNNLTGLYANFISGMVDPAKMIGTYGKAFGAMNKARTGSTAIVAGGKTAREIIREMTAGKAYGLVGQFGELAKSKYALPDGVVKKMAAAGVEGGLPAIGLLTGRADIFMFGPRFGRKVGEMSENVHRLAHVIDRLDRGFPMGDAIMSAKRYHFDYSDLTPFERDVMRRIVPFYTWTRKNTPIMLKTLVTDPGKVSVLAHIQRTLEQGDGGQQGPIDKNFVPPWIRERLNIVRPDEQDDMMVLSGAGYGIEDLAIFSKDPRRFWQNLMNMTAPPIKATVQFITNKDLFRDRPLDKSSLAPGILDHMPDWFKNTIDFREVRRRDGRVAYEANPLWMNLISTLPTSRGFRVLDRFFVDEQDPTAPEQPLKNLGALRRQHFTPNDQARFFMIASAKALEDDLNALVRKGVVGRDGSRYWLRRDRVKIVGGKLSDEDRQEIRSAARQIKMLKQARKFGTILGLSSASAGRSLKSGQ